MFTYGRGPVSWEEIVDVFSGPTEAPQFKREYVERVPNKSGRAKIGYIGSDENGNTEICIPLPGVKKENIDIEAVDGNNVIIKANRDEHFERCGLSQEESFRATIRHNFDTKDATVTFIDGVLEIKLLKIEDVKEEGKKIEIS